METSLPSPGTRRDRLAPAYLLLAVVIVLWNQSAVELDQDFGLFLALPLVMIMGNFVFGVIWCVALIINLTREAWQSVVGLLAVPILAVTLGAYLPFNGADWIRFELQRNRYVAELATLPATERPFLKAWLFRDEGAFGAEVVETYVVYDEADQLSLPSAQWTEQWRKRVVDAGSPDRNFRFLVQPHERAPVGFRVTHIRGHFYFVALGF